MRELLANELLKEADIAEVLQAGTAEEALAALRDPETNQGTGKLPDMLVVDLNMPGMGGASLIERLRADGFQKPILVLTMHKDPHVAERVFSLGATGVAVKQDSLDDIVLAVKQTLQGKRYIGPGLVSAGLEIGRASALSAREQEVLMHIASGKQTKRIATEMNISQRTVDAHRRNIIAKTGARNAADMTRLAVDLGLVS
eukprot:s1_g990.t1